MRKWITDIYYVLSIAVILIGGIMWLSAIDQKATAAYQKIDQDQKAFEEIRIRLVHLEDSNRRIEDALK